MSSWIGLLIVLWATSQGALSLTGYHCSNGGVARATLSTVDVDECMPGKKKPVVRSEIIALTQTATGGKLRLNACLVEAKHRVFRCGKSYDQNYADGEYSEIVPMTRMECLEHIKSGAFFSPHTKGKVELAPGFGKKTLSMITAGAMDNEGNCTPHPGGLFANGVRFDRPVRMTDYTFTIRNVNARIIYDENKIVLNNGVRRDYEEGQAFDADMGYMYWEKQIPTCVAKKLPQELVYKGPASLVEATEKGANVTYVIVDTDSRTFQIKVQTSRPTFVCGMASFYTEHPNLFLTTVTGMPNLFPEMPEISPENVNLNAFVSSKILYSARTTMSQVEDMFEALRLERCANGVKTLRDWLSMAVVSPSEFAYQYMGMPGYTAVVTGEVIRIAQCSPVDVTVAPEIVKCFDSLPVVWNSSVWYMTPRSRILVSVGKDVPCNQHLSPQFKLDGKWYARTGGLMHEVVPPLSLGLDFKQMEFSPLGGATSGGIYSESSVEDMQRALLHPLEQEALQSKITTGLREGTSFPTGYSISNLMTENDARSTLSKATFLSSIWFPLGQWLSPVVVLVFVYKCLRIVLNWALDARVMRRYFATGPAMTLACCPSLSHHMISGEINVPFVKKRVPEEKTEVVAYDPKKRDVGIDISELP